MIGLTEIRAIAMSLPLVEEGPPVAAARRIAGFKVAGKSFLGLEAGSKTMTVSLSEKDAKLVVAKDPTAYEEIWRNGRIFLGLRVDLSSISERRLRELIETSWRHAGQGRKGTR
jgi:hypothetical protein